jgi:hypothetical protein
MILLFCFPVHNSSPVNVYPIFTVKVHQNKKSASGNSSGPGLLITLSNQPFGPPFGPPQYFYFVTWPSSLLTIFVYLFLDLIRPRPRGLESNRIKNGKRLWVNHNLIKGLRDHFECISTPQKSLPPIIPQYPPHSSKSAERVQVKLLEKMEKIE